MSSKLLSQDYELVAIDKLQPHPENPRKGSVEGIAQSIATNGFYRPVVAQKSTGRILAGNHSWAAAKSEGFREIPVVWVDVNDADALKILLADNRLNDIATYDQNALAAVLMEARNQGALEGTGWSEKDLGDLFKSMGDEILNAAADPVAEVTEEAEIELPEQAVSRTGDMWVLGEHRLLCGDSTKLADVTRLMGGSKAIVVFTDPPYNCDYQGYTDEALTIEGDHMTDADFKTFLDATFRSYAAATVPTASLYVCHPSNKQREFQDAMEASGFEVRCQIIWAKNTFAWGFARYKFQHEPIFYAHHANETDAWYGDKSQSTLWEEKKPAANRLHPTMKPVELVQRALVNSSRAGELVLDLFGGSGSTLIAAEALKRRCRMMELDPKYCDVIVKRWELFSGKQAILQGDTGSVSFAEAAARPQPGSKAKEKKQPTGRAA